MAFLNKLAFWKREPEESSLELPASMTEEKPFVPKVSPLSEQGLEPAFAQPQQFAQPQSNPFQQPGNYDAELRLISAKLDTIKALLDVVNQRLDRFERADGRKGEDFAKWR